VRFHPDYKLRDTMRTPVPRLDAACRLAREIGVEHVYMGNVYDQPWSNTYCRTCGAELVNRYGLNAQLGALDDGGCCRSCGTDAHFTLLSPSHRAETASEPGVDYDVRSFDWHGDIRSLHVQVKNVSAETRTVFHARRNGGGLLRWSALRLDAGESYRFIIAKSQPNELGPSIAVPHGVSSNLHEVFDRAHFPTVALEEGDSDSDVTPLPFYTGRLFRQAAGVQGTP
jgi:pyruvate formate lyase activating enzyme